MPGKGEAYVTQERGERVREALEMIPSCDADNAHVEVWCIAHQRKRCDGNEVKAAANEALDSLLSRLNTLEGALEKIKRKGSVGPLDPGAGLHTQREANPWYNLAVELGSIARRALQGSEGSE